MKKTITKKQVRMLRALASSTFPDDESYHDWLRQFGKESTLDLTIPEAAVAINALIDHHPNGRKKMPLRKRRYEGSGFAGNLTQAQADRIAQLEDDLGWTENPRRLIGFIKRQTGLMKSVSMLTNRQASKVITGMERILTQKMKRAIE